MNQKTAWKHYINLPPKARKQVLDFIAFLRQSYALPPARKPAKHSDLAKETFIGLWQDREDMQDSTRWVRIAREREW